MSETENMQPLLQRALTDQAMRGAPSPGEDTALLRLVDSAFAETNLADCRIDPAAWFCRLIDLLKPLAIASRANNLSQLARFFHNDQSSKQNKKLNYRQDSGSSRERNKAPLLT
jgi:hypothetical protein